MSEIKNIAERILSDLMNDESLTNILLKTKIYATKKNDKQLLEWVERELNEYKDNLPAYRILDARVKVDIDRGRLVINNFEYPIDMVRDNDIRKRLRRMSIHLSISEIEIITGSSESIIIQDIPLPVWLNHLEYCVNGNIQRAYQYTTIVSLRKILTSVKSLLIDYFLKISEDESFNFAQLMKKEEKDVRIDNRTIYTAAVINTGSGSVHATNVTNLVGDNNTISIEVKKELQHIIDEVEKSLQPLMNEDCKELINEIKEEVSAASPKPKKLKRCLQALKGIVSDVATSVVSGQVIELIGKVLSML